MNRISKTVYFEEDKYEKLIDEIYKLSKKEKKALSFSEGVNIILSNSLNNKNHSS